MNWSDADRAWMQRALWLARRGRGYTEPNPMVGAQWVDGDRLLASGWHRELGAPHAERMALDASAARGGTLYVTLEPCVHHGRTPPCVDRILEKGVERVVACRRDPDPRVDGRGFQQLRDAGVRVDVGCLEEEHALLNRRYLTARSRGYPWVALKAGVSLDGRMTDARGRSQWVTPEPMRRAAHSLRGEFSAVMVGSGTARRDDPRLDLRHRNWRGKGHLRVVLDSRNTLPEELNLFQDQERFPTAVFSADSADNRAPRTRRHRFVAPAPDGVDLEGVLRELGDMGVGSVLVEGGPTLINSLLCAGLWDEMYLFCAGTLLGGGDAPGLLSRAMPVEEPLRLRRHRVWEIPGGFVLWGTA